MNRTDAGCSIAIVLSLGLAGASLAGPPRGGRGGDAPTTVTGAAGSGLGTQAAAGNAVRPARPVLAPGGALAGVANTRPIAVLAPRDPMRRPTVAVPGVALQDGVLVLGDLDGYLVVPHGERIMVRLPREPRTPEVRGLGAGDLYASVRPVAVGSSPDMGHGGSGGAPDGPGGGHGDPDRPDRPDGADGFDGFDDFGGFSGPAVPPGPFIRPDCLSLGSSCYVRPLGLQNVAEALAGETPERADPLVREPTALRPMERLGLYLRAWRAEELLASTEGRLVLDDIGNGRGEPPQQAPTMAVRLRRESMLACVERYEAMFDVDASESSDPEDDPGVRIRSVIADAWSIFVRDGRGPEPAGFQSFLRSDPALNEALAYVNGLRALFAEMAIMGITPAEMRSARKSILTPITPPSVSTMDLEQAIGLQPV